MRSSLHLNDDTNQFGPGSDLMISLAAVLLMLTVVVSHLYGRERLRAEEDRTKYETLRAGYVRDSTRFEEQRAGFARDSAAAGSFRVASGSVPAADFYPNPVTRLVNPEHTELRVQQIVEEYRRQDYPYVFVIGHSNSMDSPTAPDRSRRARLQRNWEYAGRRAALIAALIEAHLTEAERDRLVVMNTGELDMRDPAHPLSQENAWVEIVFGKEWKLPSPVPEG
jgi:hypothetical protein